MNASVQKKNLKNLWTIDDEYLKFFKKKLVKYRLNIIASVKRYLNFC